MTSTPKRGPEGTHVSLHLVGLILATNWLDGPGTLEYDVK